MSPHSSLSRFAALILFAVVTLGSADPASGQSREYINARSASDGAVQPFSGAVRVGETLYLSGTIGLNEDREIPATAEEEADSVCGSSWECCGCLELLSFTNCWHYLVRPAGNAVGN